MREKQPALCRNKVQAAFEGRATVFIEPF
jgi:hypothetical protein